MRLIACACAFVLVCFAPAVSSGCENAECAHAEYEAALSNILAYIYFYQLSLQPHENLMDLRRDLEDIVNRGVPGDIYETGIKFGGTALYMVGVIEGFEKSRGIEHSRNYYFFDSFEGFRSAPNNSIDGKFNTHLLGFRRGKWSAGSRGVDDMTYAKAHFQRHGLLLPRVHFIKGFFEDTIPIHATMARQKIAFLRLDGDLYSSTMVALKCLYPHVSVGGWTIVDDYLWDPGKRGVYPCKLAVDSYKLQNGLTETLTFVPPGIMAKWKKNLDSVVLGPSCKPGAQYYKEEQVEMFITRTEF